MRRRLIIRIATLCIGMAFMTSASCPQEQSIQKKDVPGKVLEAFQKTYPKASVKGYSKEVERDTLTYEIESVEETIHRDVTYLADGAPVSVEESMPFGELPEVVRKAIAKEYPDARVSTCEKITKAETVQYEVQLTSGKQTLEIVFNEDGAVAAKEKQ